MTPKARRNSITGLHAGALKVAVTEPPDKGKANEAVIALLAKALGLAPSCIELLAGHTSRDKQVAIKGFLGGVNRLVGLLVNIDV